MTAPQITVLVVLAATVAMFLWGRWRHDMGPGGFRFDDYWRLGLPLEVLVVAVGVPAILWAWPL